VQNPKAVLLFLFTDLLWHITSLLFSFTHQQKEKARLLLLFPNLFWRFTDLLLIFTDE
jgi:hypothetical protein